MLHCYYYYHLFLYTTSLCFDVRRLRLNLRRRKSIRFFGGKRMRCSNEITGLPKKLRLVLTSVISQNGGRKLFLYVVGFCSLFLGSFPSAFQRAAVFPFLYLPVIGAHLAFGPAAATTENSPQYCPHEAAVEAIFFRQRHCKIETLGGEN